MKVALNLLILGLLNLHGGMAGAAFAQSPSPNSGSLKLELNGAEQEGDSCRLIFVTQNGMDAALESLAFEFVLFDGNGLVSDMNVFDFGGLPAGKTVVKRFKLSGTPCASLSRLLVNGTSRCELAGGGEGACSGLLETANRTNIGFGKYRGKRSRI